MGVVEGGGAAMAGASVFGEGRRLRPRKLIFIRVRRLLCGSCAVAPPASCGGGNWRWSASTRLFLAVRLRRIRDGMRYCMTCVRRVCVRCVCVRVCVRACVCACVFCVSRCVSVCCSTQSSWSRAVRFRPLKTEFCPPARPGCESRRTRRRPARAWNTLSTFR